LSQVFKSNYVPVSPVIHIKEEPKEDDYTLEDDIVNSEADEQNETKNELTLLGSIKAVTTGSKVKKNKKLHSKEFLQKKLAAQHEEQVWISIDAVIQENGITFCLIFM
jgi:hypothetical protein